MQAKAGGAGVDAVTAALTSMLEQLSTLADTDTDPAGGVSAATRIDRPQR